MAPTYDSDSMHICRDDGKPEDLDFNERDLACSKYEIIGEGGQRVGQARQPGCHRTSFMDKLWTCRAGAAFVAEQTGSRAYRSCRSYVK